MKAEIELECKRPEVVVKSLKPDREELTKFDVKITPGKNRLNLRVEAEDISGLLAGINSYMRLIRVAIDATEI
jgi:tRNA threonylcarbamoyladenosine modification (KEOPS) complex  Pcc1 subunit